MKGRDVFIVLPTGFGKTLCYACLCLLHFISTTLEDKSIIIVICPLTASIKDQVENVNKHNVQAENVIKEKYRVQNLWLTNEGAVYKSTV